MTNRRTFFQYMAGLSGALALQQALTPAMAQKIIDYQCIKPELATDEDYWTWVRNQFLIPERIVNLNNGGVSPSPLCVQKALFEYYDFSNHGPSYFMWRELDKKREALTGQLASLAGCSPGEIAINRNATEALNTIIFGLDFKKGDEVVTAAQDYPNMINAWAQRQKRDGLVVKKINLRLPEDDDEVLVNAYVEAFTPRTRLVYLTHIINWTGQIIPVKRIADEAHKRGIEVLVDGAHSFAHLNYKIPDLGADYYGTSLHKWLLAPLGTGMLYIKKEKIKNVWPLLSNTDPESDDIKKFESLGTRSFATEMAIEQAISFFNMTGAEKKLERLRFLRQYWVNAVKDNPNIQFNSS
ncbi:MAG: aminotransferase class V-fold PLP-dependent enzyme, partial [Dinghuibacter sp.]|nr:aminotransferase class V-fold PLP-dependent enzyme [Dinghuibacter sp.]